MNSGFYFAFYVTFGYLVSRILIVGITSILLPRTNQSLLQRIWVALVLFSSAYLMTRIYLESEEIQNQVLEGPSESEGMHTNLRSTSFEIYALASKELMFYVYQSVVSFCFWYINTALLLKSRETNQKNGHISYESEESIGISRFLERFEGLPKYLILGFGCIDLLLGFQNIVGIVWYLRDL